MFDSLDEQMKHDREKESTRTERWTLWAVVIVVTLGAFVGLVWGVQNNS